MPSVRPVSVQLLSTRLERSNHGTDKFWFGTNCLQEADLSRQVNGTSTLSPNCLTYALSESLSPDGPVVAQALGLSNVSRTLWTWKSQKSL